MIAGAGLGLVGGLFGAFKGAPRYRGPSAAAINAKYMGMNPKGVLSPEDIAFGERARARGMETIGSKSKQARMQAASRLAQQGLTGGGVHEQANSEINAAEVAGFQDVNRDVEDALYGINRDNTEFERKKLFAGWGSELDEARTNRGLAMASQSTYWNSMLQLFPQLLNLTRRG